MMNRFSFAKFRFQIIAENEFSLPSFTGTTIRGGFGFQFKKIVCLKKELPDCHDCALKKVCAYAYIFETFPPEDSEKLRKIQDIPRPFVLEPPEDSKRLYKKGEKIEFNLVLIGKGIDYLPYFIFTFKELGKKGLGREKGRFFLERVSVPMDLEEKNFKTIYEGKDEALSGSYQVWDLTFLMKGKNPGKVDEITLNFITQTRIKHNGKLLKDPEFHHIIRALLHRISALSYFHCGEELNIDFKGTIERANRIKILESNLKWKEIERFSTRQKRRMRLGGFVGRVKFKGDFNEFMPFLLLGEQVHIGKSCTFGFGKFRIEN